jgi:predicted  nucleic acid-binding Zn-ribbon protein
MVGGTLLVCGGIGLILGINRGIANTANRNAKPISKKYTVEIEFTDPMLVSEIQTLKQLQEVYNAQILQQMNKHDMLQDKYNEIVRSIRNQNADKDYTSQIGGTNADVNSKLYESKIAELSESKNELMGQMLKIEEKMLKLTKQSDGITAKLNKIALTEYKRQNQ